LELPNCVFCLDAAAAQEEPEAVDPYDLLQAQEILSQLPKTFYDDIVGYCRFSLRGNRKTIY